jgi:hypothetical protein
LAKSKTTNSESLSTFKLAAFALAFLGRRGAATLIALAVLVVFFITGWRAWGPTILKLPAYTLSEEKFDVTPQPAWIHGNIKQEALRSGDLAKLSILDPKLVEKVEHAFAVQTWVADVKRVAKTHPAQVVVELEYRRPVGMVEVTQGDERGLLPIDTYGVLLPPEDFSTNQVRKYLRISIGSTTPQGPVGTPWGDARIAAAAKIALALEDCWPKLQLYRIQHTGDDIAGSPTFDLLTRDGAKVIWGHAPGQEASGEATAREKLAQLAAWHEKHGPLSAAGEKKELNVRDGQLTQGGAKKTR